MVDLSKIQSYIDFTEYLFDESIYEKVDGYIGFYQEAINELRNSADSEEKSINLRKIQSAINQLLTEEYKKGLSNSQQGTLVGLQNVLNMLLSNNEQINLPPSSLAVSVSAAPQETKAEQLLQVSTSAQDKKLSLDRIVDFLKKELRSKVKEEIGGSEEDREKIYRFARLLFYRLQSDSSGSLLSEENYRKYFKERLKVNPEEFIRGPLQYAREVHKIYNKIEPNISREEAQLINQLGADLEKKSQDEESYRGALKEYENEPDISFDDSHDILASTVQAGQADKILPKIIAAGINQGTANEQENKSNTTLLKPLSPLNPVNESLGQPISRPVEEKQASIGDEKANQAETHDLKKESEAPSRSSITKVPSETTVEAVKSNQASEKVVLEWARKRFSKSAALRTEIKEEKKSASQGLRAVTVAELLERDNQFTIGNELKKMFGSDQKVIEAYFQIYQILKEESPFKSERSDSGIAENQFFAFVDHFNRAKLGAALTVGQVKKIEAHMDSIATKIALTSAEKIQEKILYNIMSRDSEDHYLDDLQRGDVSIRTLGEYFEDAFNPEVVGNVFHSLAKDLIKQYPNNYLEKYDKAALIISGLFSTHQSKKVEEKDISAMLNQAIPGYTSQAEFLFLVGVINRTNDITLNGQELRLKDQTEKEKLIAKPKADLQRQELTRLPVLGRVRQFEARGKPPLQSKLEMPIEQKKEQKTLYTLKELFQAILDRHDFGANDRLWQCIDKNRTTDNKLVLNTDQPGSAIADRARVLVEAINKRGRIPRKQGDQLDLDEYWDKIKSSSLVFQKVPSVPPQKTAQPSASSNYNEQHELKAFEVSISGLTKKYIARWQDKFEILEKERLAETDITKKNAWISEFEKLNKSVAQELIDEAKKELDKTIKKMDPLIAPGKQKELKSRMQVIYSSALREGLETLKKAVKQELNLEKKQNDLQSKLAISPEPMLARLESKSPFSPTIPRPLPVSPLRHGLLEPLRRSSISTPVSPVYDLTKSLEMLEVRINKLAKKSAVQIQSKAKQRKEEGKGMDAAQTSMLISQSNRRIFEDFVEAARNKRDKVIEEMRSEVNGSQAQEFEAKINETYSKVFEDGKKLIQQSIQDESEIDVEQKNLTQSRQDSQKASEVKVEDEKGKGQDFEFSDVDVEEIDVVEVPAQKASKAKVESEEEQDLELSDANMEEIDVAEVLAQKASEVKVESEEEQGQDLKFSDADVEEVDVAKTPKPIKRAKILRSPSLPVLTQMTLPLPAAGSNTQHIPLILPSGLPGGSTQAMTARLESVDNGVLKIKAQMEISSEHAKPNNYLFSRGALIVASDDDVDNDLDDDKDDDSAGSLAFNPLLLLKELEKLDNILYVKAYETSTRIHETLVGRKEVLNEWGTETVQKFKEILAKLHEVYPSSGFDRYINRVIAIENNIQTLLDPKNGNGIRLKADVINVNYRGGRSSENFSEMAYVAQDESVASIEMRLQPKEGADEQVKAVYTLIPGDPGKLKVNEIDLKNSTYDQDGELSPQALKAAAKFVNDYIHYIKKPNEILIIRPGANAELFKAAKFYCAAMVNILKQHPEEAAKYQCRDNELENYERDNKFKAYCDSLKNSPGIKDLMHYLESKSKPQLQESLDGFINAEVVQEALQKPASANTDTIPFRHIK